MKRKIFAFFTALFSIVLLVGFTACKEKDPEPVVITVGESVGADTTLLEYMDSTGIDYEIDNGMISELSGVKNSTKSYWMLYTTDVNNANATWGTYEYDGETLGSAMWGADVLIVAQGETYIWVYQTF
ncbi:MAG: hypothetical protein J6A38_06015 [Clostridia bacterium]|nr:hypothetical protein [Clostridia bacterium]